MIRFRILGFKDLQQAIALLEGFQAENPTETSSVTKILRQLKSVVLPFHHLSHWLPLELKYLPEIYVASENDQVMSLIWLVREGGKQDYWRIEEVIINPNAINAITVTKQLIQYALSQLSGKGVETFLAHIQKHATEALGLLKECGFRYCTSMTEWQLASDSDRLQKPTEIPNIGFREASAWDAKYILALYTDSLPPEIRVSLRKEPEELYPNMSQSFIRQCKGQFYKAWVLPHKSQEYYQAFLSIKSKNYRDFKVTIIYSMAVNELLTEILNYALYQIFLNGSRVTIHLETFSYQKALQELLENKSFDKGQEQDILVKDHWMPIQDKENTLLKSPLLLFSDKGKTSPA